MSYVQLSADRSPHDLGRFIFSCGDVGRLKVIDATPVFAGDSYEADMVGAIRLSPLRRGLAIDSKVDIVTCYIPHRHIYGDQLWKDFLLNGNDDSIALPTMQLPPHRANGAFLGIVPNSQHYQIPAWLGEGYCRIYDNYFAMPEKLDVNGQYLSRNFESWPSLALNNGWHVSHLKNVWTAPLPDDTKSSQAVDTSSGLDLVGLNMAYAKLHTDQERDLFMRRYRDVIEKFGGETNYDADKRPHLLMRSEFWASGYDVDGADQTSLGQFSGRVNQSFNHRIPRFFCPEHGAIITVAVLRFPPIHELATPYYIGEPAHRYSDFAGDPSLDGNLPPRDIPMSRLFHEGAPNNTLKLAHGQWFRSVPDYVDVHYAALEGFPFIKRNPTEGSSAAQIVSEDYDQCFQTTQLRHWNMQAKTNVIVHRRMPDAREAILTSK